MNRFQPASNEPIYRQLFVPYLFIRLILVSIHYITLCPFLFSLHWGNIFSWLLPRKLNATTIRGLNKALKCLYSLKFYRKPMFGVWWGKCVITKYNNPMKNDKAYCIQSFNWLNNGVYAYLGSWDWYQSHGKNQWVKCKKRIESESKMLHNFYIMSSRLILAASV